jgi:hypothetical protein
MTGAASHAQLACVGQGSWIGLPHVDVSGTGYDRRDLIHTHHSVSCHSKFLFVEHACRHMVRQPRAISCTSLVYLIAQIYNEAEVMLVPAASVPAAL